MFFNIIINKKKKVPNLFSYKERKNTTELNYNSIHFQK